MGSHRIGGIVVVCDESHPPRAPQAAARSFGTVAIAPWGWGRPSCTPSAPAGGAPKALVEVERRDAGNFFLSGTRAAPQRRRRLPLSAVPPSAVGASRDSGLGEEVVGRSTNFAN